MARRKRKPKYSKIKQDFIDGFNALDNKLKTSKIERIKYMRATNLRDSKRINVSLSKLHHYTSENHSDFDIADAYDFITETGNHKRKVCL